MGTSKSTGQYSGESKDLLEMEEGLEVLEAAAILIQMHQEDRPLSPMFSESEQGNSKTLSFSTEANSSKKSDISGKKEPANDTDVRGLKETVNNVGGYM